MYSRVCSSPRDPPAVGQADPEPVLPGQQPHREDRRRRARVDGQAHGRGDDSVTTKLNLQLFDNKWH